MLSAALCCCLMLAPWPTPLCLKIIPLDITMRADHVERLLTEPRMISIRYFRQLLHHSYHSCIVTASGWSALYSNFSRQIEDTLYLYVLILIFPPTHWGLGHSWHQALMRCNDDTDKHSADAGPDPGPGKLGWWDSDDDEGVMRLMRCQCPGPRLQLPGCGH